MRYLTYYFNCNMCPLVLGSNINILGRLRSSPEYGFIIYGSNKTCTIFMNYSIQSHSDNILNITYVYINCVFNLLYCVYNGFITQTHLIKCFNCNCCCLINSLYTFISSIFDDIVAFELLLFELLILFIKSSICLFELFNCSCNCLF